MPITRNLAVAAGAYFLIKLQFWFPIWVIFLLDKGLTLRQIVVADVVYWLSIIVFEFPMGVLGDRIGRRRTFFLGAVLGGVAYFLMTRINGFGWLLFTWVVWGVYMATLSGTDVAMIYELIVDAGMGERSHHILGYFSALQSAAFILSTLVAGFLYAIDADLPIYLNALVAVLAALLVLAVSPPASTIRINSREQVSQVIDLFLRRPSHRFLMVFMAVLYAYTYAATLLIQPLLVSFGIPVDSFGPIFASFPVFAVLGGLLTGRLSDVIGRRRYVSLVSGLLVVSMFLVGVGSPAVSILGIVLVYLFFALVNPILLSELNRGIDDSYRSSVISFASLLSSTGLVFTRPGISYVAGLTSLRTSYMVWSGLGGLLLVVLLGTLARSEGYLNRVENII